MKTYIAEGVISKDHRLILDIPCDMDAGKVEVVLVLSEKDKSKKMDNRGLLGVEPLDCGEILSKTLSREEIYEEYR